MILGNVAITAGTGFGNLNDPNYNNVGLLLTGTAGTNGATNNTFLDSSPYGQTVTRNGDVTQGSFTPYLGTGYYSAYFDGTSDTVTFTGSAGPQGTEDFTVEMYVYITTMGGNFPRLFESTVVNTWQLYLSNGVLTYAQNNVAGILSFNISALTNQWLHICVTRSGTAARMFVNGVLRAYTASGGTNFASSTSWRSANEGGGIIGYISNFRVVRGAVVSDYSTSVTATGTTVFTPPVNPLTAVSNTSLLSFQSNRFIDNSLNNWPVTISGDTRVVHFNPFTWNGGPYSTTFNGGSMYFDGTGDYLTAASSPLYAFGTGNFTIEAWVYTTSFTTQRIVSLGTGNNGELLLVNSGSNVWLDWFDGTVDIGSNTTFVTQNAWVHVAVTRSSSTVRVFINGIVSGTPTTSTRSYGTVATYIGTYGGSLNTQNFIGYISNVRIINGTAVYTAAFTPPTQPLQSVPNTVLLLNGTNAGIVDRSENNNLVTGSGSQLSTVQTRFNATSLFIPGTSGGAVTFPYSAANNWLTTTFTVEAWVYVVARSAAETPIFSQDVVTTSNYAYQALSITNAGVLRFDSRPTTGGAVTSMTGGTVPLTTWTYVTVSVNAGSARIFINGTQVGSTTAFTFMAATLPVFNGVGGFGNGFNLSAGANTLNGYIDDLVVTRGVSKYNANFTPPTYSPLGF